MAKNVGNSLESKNQTHVNWEELEYLTAKLSKIIQTNIKPDFILCIGRGGWVFGRILSSILVVPLATILTRHYKNMGNRGKFYIDKNIVSPKPLKGTVIIVDDVVHTGKTMEEVLKVVKKKRNIKKIFTAALYYNKEESKFAPDMFVNEFRKGEWVVFPYEKEAYEGVEF